jgi:hypothetical protein
MRIGLEILALARLVAAVVGMAAASMPCEARDPPRSAVETGHPSSLINRPACGTGEVFDEWPHCGAIDRPWAKHRSLID